MNWPLLVPLIIKLPRYNSVEVETEEQVDIFIRAITTD